MDLLASKVNFDLSQLSPLSLSSLRQVIAEGQLLKSREIPYATVVEGYMTVERVIKVKVDPKGGFQYTIKDFAKNGNGLWQKGLDIITSRSLREELPYIDRLSLIARLI